MNLKIKQNWIWILSIVLFIAINVVLSIINIPAIDFSENKLFSISDRTKEVLKSLNEPVNIYVYSNEGEDGMGISEILEVYKRKSSNINVEYVGTDESAIIAKKYGVTLGNDIITVAKGDKSKNIKFSDLYNYNEGAKQQEITVESELTAGILAVNSESVKKIVFLEGHGEYSVDSEISILNDSLRYNAYDISIINLLKDEIEQDVDLVAIIGGQYDLTDIEKSKLEAYLNNGGALIVAKDTESINESNNNLDALLSNYGVIIKKDIIIDKQRVTSYYNYLYFNVLKLANHESTKDLLKTNVISDIYSRSLETVDYTKQGEMGIQVEPIMVSSDSAYTSSINDFSNYFANKPADAITQSYNVGVISTKNVGEKTSKVIVIGNSSIFVNDLLQINKPNQDLIMSFVRWAIGGEKIESGVEGKAINTNRFNITYEQGRVMMILLFVFSIAIVIVGIVVVAIRRKK